MTFESYANRLTTHFNQLLNRVTGPRPTGTIDLTPRTPKLSFLQGKQFRQGNGGRKNRSDYNLEHTQANKDNRNPYKGDDGRWYYYDETEQSCETGYVTREQAEIALNDYVKWLNNPKEIVAEPMPVSIGGVPEVGLVEGNDLL